MKKIVSYLIMPLLIVTLAACGQKENNAKQTTNSSNSTSTTKSTSSTERSTKDTSKSESHSSSTSISSETATSSSKSSSENTGKEAENAPNKQAQIVLEELSSYFPGISLPKSILTNSTKTYLTAATTPTAYQDNFRILYYATDYAIPVNDLRINQLTPIASFEKRTYQTQNDAQMAVNQIVDDGGQEVDLGYGIIGHKQGAAGSSYLSWGEGNWRIAVKATNIQGETPVDLSKEVVAYLEKATLPAPKNVGQIVLNVYPSEYFEYNSVIWQEDTVVYFVKHFDPMQAVKMAVSTRQ